MYYRILVLDGSDNRRATILQATTQPARICRVVFIQMNVEFAVDARWNPVGRPRIVPVLGTIVLVGLDGLPHMDTRSACLVSN